MIGRHEGTGVHARRARVLDLLSRALHVRFLRRQFFLRGRLRNRSPFAAIEAGAIVGHVVYDGLVVDVRDVDVRDVVDGAVVEEDPVVPTPALIAGTGIAEAIRNPAVKADVRSPIASVENVGAVDEGPISRRPEQSGLRRLDPCSRHPIIIHPVVGPIARRPEIPRLGDRRLIVNRHGRRRFLRLNGVAASASSSATCASLSERGVQRRHERRRGKQNSDNGGT